MFLGLIMLSIVVEGLITYFKAFVIEGKLQWQLIASMVLGIIVAVNYGMDLMALLGFNSMFPFVGSVITGVIVSRGSNYMFDFIGELTAIKLKE